MSEKANVYLTLIFLDVLPEGTGALFALKKNPKDMNEQITVKLVERKEVSRDSIIYTFEFPSDMTLGLNVCKHIAIEY
jgi:hypothetical protein